MSFAHPYLAALVVLLVPILWLGPLRRKVVGHTQVGIHKNVRSTPLIGWIPTILLVAAWSLFCVGMMGPRLTTYTDKETIEARDIVIMVDVSGSMTTALQVKNQQDFVQQSESDDSAGKSTDTTAQSATPSAPVTFTRATAARMGVKKFVDARNGDRVALLLFDDQVYNACTFTRDMKIMNKKLPLINQYQGGGTNFDGPNDDSPYSKVGAIQGAINYFKQSGQSKTKVLIMVTDGEDSINAKRFTELGAQLHDLGIHMYVLGVGESWTSGTVDLHRFVDSVNGKVFIVGDAEAMRDGIAEINKLEKSQIVVERTQNYKPLYIYFLLAALSAALLYKLAAMMVREEE